MTLHINFKDFQGPEHCRPYAQEMYGFKLMAFGLTMMLTFELLITYSAMSSAHSRDEYMCQVSLASCPINY